MINIDEVLFRKVFQSVFEAYRRQIGIFAKYPVSEVGPQHIFWPKNVVWGSKDHLYWLTLVAFSDRRTNSTVLYRNFARMFERNPSLFRRGRYPSVQRMTQLFRRYRIALPIKEITFFLDRKRHLDSLFKGDPSELYDGIENTAGLMGKLRVVGKGNGVRNLFPGAKEKIFSLLAMFLREHINLKFADVVPVDVWVQAICASTDVLSGGGYIKSEDLEKRLRPLMTAVFSEFLNTTGAANATWILGKFGCTHCHRTDMTNLCPIYHLCRGPFERMRHPISGKHFGAIGLPPKFKNKFAESKL